MSYNYDENGIASKPSASESSSGSSAGTGMMDSFSQLGQDIQNQSQNQIQMIQDWKLQQKDRRRQAKLDAEEKKKWKKQMYEGQRGTNLGMIQALQQQRMQAEKQSRVKAFITGLTK